MFFTKRRIIITFKVLHPWYVWDVRVRVVTERNKTEIDREMKDFGDTKRKRVEMTQKTKMKLR